MDPGHGLKQAREIIRAAEPRHEIIVNQSRAVDSRQSAYENTTGFVSISATVSNSAVLSRNRPASELSHLGLSKEQLKKLSSCGDSSTDHPAWNVYSDAGGDVCIHPCDCT